MADSQTKWRSMIGWLMLFVALISTIGLSQAKPSLKYRQHQSNTYGANIGLTAKWARLQQLKTSWYRDEIIKISKVCYKVSADPSIGKLIKVLEDKGLTARLSFLSYISKIQAQIIR